MNLNNREYDSADERGLLAGSQYQLLSKNRISY